MPVRPSGPLPLSEIQAEFGGSNPISLSEYYRGGGLVPNGPAANNGIATSGAISMGGFYNSVRTFVFRPVIASNTGPYNLRTAAVGAGWDQVTPLDALVTVNGGVAVGASSTGNYAFDTGSGFPAGSVLALRNAGFITGVGGNGGVGAGYNPANGVGVDGSGGAGGGPALIARHPISIDNTGGTIAGGGGGGGGGANITSNNGKEGLGMGGGGGGGGRASIAANAAGGGAGSGYDAGFVPPSAAAGATGTFSGQGGGGSGASINLGQGTVFSGAGGSGGAWGASGASGGGRTGNSISPAQNRGPYGGGPAGNATEGSGNITWTNVGTRLGALA